MFANHKTFEELRSWARKTGVAPLKGGAYVQPSRDVLIKRFVTDVGPFYLLHADDVVEACWFAGTRRGYRSQKLRPVDAKRVWDAVSRGAA